MQEDLFRNENTGPIRRSWFERHKPAASRRAHLAAAGAIWSLVGAGLTTLGLVWILRAAGRWTVLAIALVLGAVKGFLVLRRTVRRNVARIEARGDGRCLGGFMGLRGWALVAAMMLAGRLLRASPIPRPRPVLGTLYLAIGFALFVASMEIWWAHHRTGELARRPSPP